MKKSNMLMAAFVVLATASAARADGGTMGNLAETSDKISSIDMNKDPGAAGKILDGFYSGIKSKKDVDSSVVYAESGAAAAAPQGKDICNAKPSKIILAGKVPALEPTSGKTGSDKKGLPVGTGALAAGLLTLGISRKTKSSSYSADVSTVWHAVTHPGETAHDFQAAHDYEQSHHTPTPGAPNGFHPDHLPNDNACNSVDSNGDTNCGN